MATFKLNPPDSGISPEDYRRYVKETIRNEIMQHGSDGAMWHKDFVILYSGPTKDAANGVEKVVKHIFKSNHERSLTMALEMDASRIDDTNAAVYLNEYKLDDCFRDVLLKRCKNARELADALSAAYAEVWGGISELFAELDFKTVATAVCGAGQDRVFIRDELPMLIKNPHVETINNIDMNAVREMYNEVSPDEAFRLVCLSELKVTYGGAKTTTRALLSKWTDFFERVSFYQAERGKTEPKVSALSSEQRQRKDAIVKKYGLGDLYVPPPEAWGGPLVAVPKRASAMGCSQVFRL